ncbi:hypothetical protein B0A48_15939 [Cryoendolithus antarcticus]|uniref:AAA+ ATPase domain-containing protein n=1 Tax=Cryoendolithus antarcticus TaxID=1507870 RepID=A0A1V8SGE6_9PEZI|nr:hypothetical protein B0A48_15939 [Cryoendolithus antarcticus]
MADSTTGSAATASERQEEVATESTQLAANTSADAEASKCDKAAAKKAKCKNHKHKTKQTSTKQDKKRKSRRKPVEDSSSSDSSSVDAESSSDKSSSDDEAVKTRSKKRKFKDKKLRKTKKLESSSEESSESEASEQSESEDSDSSSEDEKSKKKKKAAAKKASKKAAKKSKKEKVASSASEDKDGSDPRRTSMQTLQAQIDELRLQTTKKTKEKTGKDKGLPFKKVDQLWDTTRHEWTLRESSGRDESEYADYAFLVRRTFNYENEFVCTLIDIKAKALRAALSEVMKDCKRVSLEAEEPTIDPNLLFLYLEELRAYYKKTLKVKIKAEKKRKAAKKLESQRKMVMTLVAYIDEDYSVIKKTLYPLIAAGNITFELLWALYKPNEIAISSCYGSWEEPRCFKVEHANKLKSMTRGEWYAVEGRYLEYDGKNFGYGEYEAAVEEFKGPRKITSLATYPLKYHQDPEGVKKMIIERGRHFTSLEGMAYRFHKGLAFHKKKKNQIVKININGRVMIDPQTFRRINPNYSISSIKPHEDDEVFSDDEEDSDDCCCGSDSDDDQAQAGGDDLSAKKKYRMVKVGEEYHMVEVDVDEDGAIVRPNTVTAMAQAGKAPVYTDEDLLLTSPVVLGFAFNEKLWLEFSLSGIRDIEYNEAAFSSLVLPPNQKSIVRALVESHKFHAAKTIDDVVQGKGKGLVAVLHGPPGTGKTLTAEGISELLKCPLYMVSAGELGTDPAKLELELQKILDIAHSWGAVLLLDEADVFLEKREVHDIHRNALVSIFLRLLEYFQGILFLTTNRVETFDDAFQSRIHVALRYGDLTSKAKRSVWAMFLDKCRAQPGTKVAEFGDKELDALARHRLNGRQIKNVVRTAQALALNEEGVLGMEQIGRVLEVAESFERDLRGGVGYVEAMRSYT